jgi:hypothetical protein
MFWVGMPSLGEQQCRKAVYNSVLTLHLRHPMSWFRDLGCASHSRDIVLHLHHRTKLELFQQESLFDLHEKPAAKTIYISSVSFT